MINEKGQAFSVFELMISGVVAFAILIILLIIIYGLPQIGPSEAKRAMETGLKAVGSSGSTLTAEFYLEPNVSIMASSFRENADLEAESIYFFKGKFKDNSLLVAETTNTIPPISYLSYKGSTQLKAKAMIICGATAEAAKTSVLTLSDKYDAPSLVDEMVAYCGEAQPCCAIILDK